MKRILPGAVAFVLAAAALAASIAWASARDLGNGLVLVTDEEAGNVVGGGCGYFSSSVSCPNYNDKDEDCHYSGFFVGTTDGDYVTAPDVSCGSCGKVSDSKNCTSS